MTDGNSGKAITKRAKPELVTIGNKTMISTAHWNDELIAYHILTHGQHTWVGIGDLARFAWGQNTITTKQRARARVSKIFGWLLVNKGALLVQQHDEENHNRTKAVKIYNPDSAEEQRYLERKLKRLRGTKELTEANYERAMMLLQAA